MLDLQKHLCTGERIELHVEQDGSPLELISCVEAVIDRDRLMIQAPFHQREYFPLQNNDRVKMVIKLEDTGLLEIEGIVRQSTHFGPTMVLIVDLEPDIRQTQRRNFYRLPVSRDVLLTDIDSEPVEGITQNISAGGVKCVAAARPRPGSVVQVHLNLNSEILVVEGQVLEAEPFDQTPNRYVSRIQFIRLSERDQAKIIAFIYQEQSRRNRLRPS